MSTDTCFGCDQPKGSCSACASHADHCRRDDDFRLARFKASCRYLSGSKTIGPAQLQQVLYSLREIFEVALTEDKAASLRTLDHWILDLAIEADSAAMDEPNPCGDELRERPEFDAQHRLVTQYRMAGAL